MTELLEYKGYRARIEFDPGEETFFGTVIDIRDSIDLQLAFQNAMEEYFEMCRQR